MRSQTPPHDDIGLTRDEDVSLTATATEMSRAIYLEIVAVGSIVILSHGITHSKISTITVMSINSGISGQPASGGSFQCL